MLDKIRAIEVIVGKDTETGSLASTFRGAGVVDAARLSLPSTDMDTVRAALRAVREKWLTGGVEATDEDKLAAAIESGDLDEDSEDEDSLDAEAL